MRSRFFCAEAWATWQALQPSLATTAWTVFFWNGALAWHSKQAWAPPALSMCGALEPCGS